MGQRLQVGINIVFVGENEVKFNQREIFHYQWGGYNNSVFESLIGFFLESKKYLINVKNFNFFREELEAKLEKYNYLSDTLINKLNSIDCDPMSIDLEEFYSEKFKNKNINQLSEKEFFIYLLEFQDCDDGRIIIDILLNKEKSFCKWAFIDNYNHGNSTFENAIKGLIDIKTIPYIWRYDTEQKKDFLKILDFINYISMGSNNDKLIEYDVEYFKKKFVTLNK